MTADSGAWPVFDCGVLKPWWRRQGVLCTPGAERRAGMFPTLNVAQRLISIQYNIQEVNMNFAFCDDK